MNSIFEADESIILPLIVSFRLTFGSGSPQEDLFRQFKNELIPDEIVEQVMHYAQVGSSATLIFAWSVTRRAALA